MRKIRSYLLLVLLLSITGYALSSCSKDEKDTPSEIVDTEHQPKNVLSLGTILTESQKESLNRTGYPFTHKEEKDAWNSSIASNIPTSWGVSELSQPLRALGVGGYYAGRYWSMVRVKTGNISETARYALNEAIAKIEESTNVRFYNSQFDPEYHEPFHIKLPNVFVRTVPQKYISSSNVGLVGGEQFIDVPDGYEKDDLTAYLMHALCNAAGMFNEIQRKDRDRYVDIKWDNIAPTHKTSFDMVGGNYTQQGYFDYNSITMFSSYDLSKNGQPTVQKKGGG